MRNLQQLADARRLVKDKPAGGLFEWQEQLANTVPALLAIIRAVPAEVLAGAIRLSEKETNDPQQILWPGARERANND